MIYEIEQLEDTKQAATHIAALLRTGDVVALEGPMGSGKTTLTGFIARALGAEDSATSPTFAIAQRYDGPLPIWHLDLYRIEEADLYDIGYEDYFYPEEAITFIEWPDKAGSLLPASAFRIRLTKEGGRRLELDPRLAKRGIKE